MLFCKSNCYVSFIFLLASIYVSLKTDKEGVIKPLENILTSYQLDEYKKVRDDRRSIYMKGLLYGLTVGLVLIYLKGGIKDILSNVISGSCYILSVMLVVSYLYYILSEKKSIITILDNKKQREAWYKVYRHMQVNYHTGILLGIIGGGIYGWQYCNDNIW